jgi:peptidoglycan/LPS O-acetylase OafA/YrhL
MPVKTTTARIDSIDTARFLAMALVFYGHFIERVMVLKNPTAAAVFPGDFFHLNLPCVQGYIDGPINTAFGIPLFCVPPWFLILIF